MNKLLPIATFVGGAVIGAIVGWSAHKKKYEDQLEAETESIRKTYEKKYVKISKADLPKVEDTAYMSEEEFKDYVNKRVEAKKEYNKITAQYQPEGEVVTPDMTIEERAAAQPELIYAQDYTEEQDNGEKYDGIELLWFKDDRLATDAEMELLDVATTIGWDAIAQFDKTGLSTIYVRNHRLKVDYEVFKYDGTYEELLAERPHLDKEL